MAGRGGARICGTPIETIRASTFNPAKRIRVTPTSGFSTSSHNLSRLAIGSIRRPTAEKRDGAVLGELRRFHSAPRLRKEHHFDTLKFVQRLKEEGLTEEQSVGLMRVLSDVIDESVQNLARTMVLRDDFDKTVYTQKVDFAKLRSELHGIQNSEFNSTRAEYERLTSELNRLNARLRDEIARAQNSFRLDLNLEKGRIREEASVHELKIKETDTRIESEVGLLKGVLESVKFSTLQWLIGVCTGTAALILGIWRLLM
ncbi:DUF1640-domain-containing protein [Ascobolus immersus RN42]|uniref:DUF1640-domain-containing protein n=1 Tax=Ascobolus immersus RN42 TaxID=1160509 RepID=A0A3N4I630_ASCIM|nr:DUF1640-domain-containing protein [Ascobolus immersus RN42]